MSDARIQMPVEEILPELTDALATSQAVVLQGPPGSGKTTRVPLALLEAPWLAGQKILMLEPRRLAATNAARYMASLRGEEIGISVGYSIRYQQKTSQATRLEVITEGLLTRRLQNDPELSGVGLVIFDEFHERSLQADLALALCRDIQAGLRDDLRLLVMSATLDSEPLAHLLDNCPIVTAHGQSHPVTIHHLDDARPNRIAEATAQGVRHALQACAGDILAFLPGAGEIHRCREYLLDLSTELDIRPLHGSLSFAEQEQAILPGPRRRVVLATNIAETSLTIEGIAAVVDSGWERRPRFDAGRSLTRLETVHISKASATQRSGRAGRLGPGHCFRLWSKGTEGALLPFAPPEIRVADLAPLVFELAQWGVRDANTLSWLDPPSDGALTKAHQLLAMLGALDDKNAVTALGRKMSRYATEPRLARLLVAAIDEGRPGLGSDLVALLSERDPFRNEIRGMGTAAQCDLLERLELMGRRKARTGSVLRASQFWRKRTRAGTEPPPDAATIGRLLAIAFPDRIGQRRTNAGNNYLLSNGRGATLGPHSSVRDADWLVAVDLHGKNDDEDEITMATRLDRTLVEELFGKDLPWHREAGWDERSGRVTAKEVRRLGALILQERPAAVTSGDTVPALLALLRQQGLELLPWTHEARQLQARANLLYQHLADQGWLDCSAKALTSELESWLASWLDGIKSRKDLQRIDLVQALKARIGWPRAKQMEQLVPERLEVPSGARIRLDYVDEEGPVLAVKLQEMFGLKETPRIVDGRVAVLVHLLSPAGRPLAVTRDLKNFWEVVYPEVKKEMKGRYPKHPWPDDPWQATASGKTKRRLASEN